jgi:CBS domain-containing protein
MELTRNLQIECVERLEPTAPHQIDAEVRVGQAVTMMREERVGCLLVTHEGKLVGIFTERDLLTRIVATGLPLTVPLRECMTSNPVSVSGLESIRTAIEKMQNGGYRHLPIVDSENRPVGILNVKQIIRYVVEHFPHVVYNQSPNTGWLDLEGG